MGINTPPEKPDSANLETTPFWLELFMILLICVAFSGVTIYVINLKREIAAFDKAIADTETCIENNKTIIENLKKQQEKLKDEKVEAFARKYNMTTPSQGQICFVAPYEMPAQRQRAFMYAGQATKASFNVATAQKNPLQASN